MGKGLALAELCTSATRRPLGLGRTPADSVPPGACPRPAASPADLGRSWPGQGLPAGPLEGLVRTAPGPGQGAGEPDLGAGQEEAAGGDSGL